MATLQPAQPDQAETRHVRGCDACGQEDDHPRHHVYDPANGDTMRHLDCCAAAGCESCAAQIAAAPESARHGQALIEHLTSREG